MMNSKYLTLKTLLPLMGVMGVLIGFWIGELIEDRPSLKEQSLFLNSLHPSTTVFPLGQALSDFSLLNHHQQKFTLENFRKKWSLLFFGYTHCPDECPQTLSVLKQVYERLGDEVSNTQIIFISIDSHRDSAEKLMDYVPGFNRAFMGVTGEATPLLNFARQFGITYQRIPNSTPHENYLIDHSISILLVDPLGKLRAIFAPPHKPEVIINDFRKIRAYYAEECCLPSAEGPKTTLIRGKN